LREFQDFRNFVDRFAPELRIDCRRPPRVRAKEQVMSQPHQAEKPIFLQAIEIESAAERAAYLADRAHAGHHGAAIHPGRDGARFRVI
jgi:hypothetical protein